MTNLSTDEVQFDDPESDEQDAAQQLPPGTVAAVVSGTDWTTETIISQLERGNIQLNPKFQRRDAWRVDRKSRFIESLIVGLPIPQIVLAESKEERGKFIVLDGKQRLLALLQFWGLGQGQSNSFLLTGLTLRKDLMGKSYSDLSSDFQLQSDLNALLNQSVRTAVVRNWIDSNFLHTVFLRLNTGSVALSPQELRQALLPGPFSNYVDDAAAESVVLRRLLGLEEPDPRMRDIEVLARFLAFRFFADSYPGRMKEFLDESFSAFNSKWPLYSSPLERAVNDFELGVEDLLRTFGSDLARKPGSRSFNRAIFDVLIYYHSQPQVREDLADRDDELKVAYESLFAPGSRFVQAVERDTAGAPNTKARLSLWAEQLSRILDREMPVPNIPVAPLKGDKKASARKSGKRSNSR